MNRFLENKPKKSGSVDYKQGLTKLRIIRNKSGSFEIVNDMQMSKKVIQPVKRLKTEGSNERAKNKKHRKLIYINSGNTLDKIN